MAGWWWVGCVNRLVDGNIKVTFLSFIILKQWHERLGLRDNISSARIKLCVRKPLE